MHLLGRNPIASSVLALTFTASLSGKALARAQNPSSQTKSSGLPKPTRHDSADVVATLSPLKKQKRES